MAAHSGSDVLAVRSPVSRRGQVVDIDQHAIVGAHAPCTLGMLNHPRRSIAEVCRLLPEGRQCFSGVGGQPGADELSRNGGRTSTCWGVAKVDHIGRRGHRATRQEPGSPYGQARRPPGSLAARPIPVSHWRPKGETKQCFQFLQGCLGDPCVCIACSASVSTTTPVSASMILLRMVCT